MRVCVKGRAPPGPVPTGPNPSMTDASGPLAEAPFPLIHSFPFPFFLNDSPRSQPDIRGAAYRVFYTLLCHTSPLRSTFLSHGAARSPLLGLPWHITPLREFRVAAIRPVRGGGPSLVTKVRAFRQIAARAPALERASGHFFAESGARRAQIRGPYTETPAVAHRKGLPVRQFGGNAFASHGIVQVSQKYRIFGIRKDKQNLV